MSANYIAEVIISHYSLESLILGGSCLESNVGTKLTSLGSNSPCYGSPLKGIELLFLGNKMLKDKELTKDGGPEMFYFLSSTNYFNAFGISKYYSSRQLN